MSIRVSDHALLRFLERHAGLDIEGLRATIEAGTARAADAAEQLGVADFNIQIEGQFFLVRGKVVVTILPEHASESRRCRTLGGDRGQ